MATKLGYEKSSKVQAGPYQLHYGQSGSEGFLLLAEGNWNILSRSAGVGTEVYLNGRGFINFEQNSDGSVTNLSLDILDADGKRRMSVIDRDVGGQWDVSHQRRRAHCDGIGYVGPLRLRLASAAGSGHPTEEQ